MKKNKFLSFIPVLYIIVFFVGYIAETGPQWIYIIKALLGIGEASLDIVARIFNNKAWGFDYLLIRSTILFQIFIPVIISITGMSVYQILHNYSKFVIHKFAKKREYLYKLTIYTALKASVISFATYLFIYLFVFICSNKSFIILDSRELFLDILGDNFIIQHPHIYFLFVDGGVRFFVIPFIYSLLANSIAVICGSGKLTFILSNLYYYIMCVIGYALQITWKYGFYLTPSVIFASGAFIDVKTVLLFPIHVVPIIVSILLIELKLRQDIL